MANYAIKYYNGKSALAHKAMISLKEDAWHIVYQKEVKPLPVEDEKPPLDPDSELVEFQELKEGDESLFESEDTQHTDEHKEENEKKAPEPVFETVEVIWELNQIHKRETGSQLNTFYYGEFPYQCIECEDATFMTQVQALYPSLNLLNKHYNRLFQMGNKGVFTVGATLITLLVLIYFFILPPVAETSILLMPREYEQNMGDGIYNTLTSNESKNQELSKMVNEFASNINFDTPYNIRITVIQSSTINAYAVPGGRIVVYTGLLDKMQNYEELAALLGHEVAHVHQRHSLKSLARALAGSLFMSVIFSDINGMTAIVTENAQYLQTMHHSRTAESEADEKAAEVMLKNKINLKGLVDLFKRLEHEHSTLEEVLSYASSHPSTSERKRIAKERLASQKQFEQHEKLATIWEQIKANL